MSIFNIQSRDLANWDYKKFIKQLNSLIEEKPKKKVRYQVVIMAAGKGSRMRSNYPKSLHEIVYPYGKNSIIRNLIKTFESTDIVVSNFHMVINVNKTEYFQNLQGPNLNLIALEDDQIRGTARCLESIKPMLDSDSNIILVWGDLAMFPGYIISLSTKINESSNASLIFPTRIKKNPYVAFVRNELGEINEIHHSNEGHVFKGDYAEQDCSIFVFNWKALNLLSKFIYSEQNELKEDLDFVHFLPFLVKEGHKVIGLPVVNMNLVSGINTPNKSQEVTSFLASLKIEEYRKIFLSNEYIASPEK